MPTQETWRVVVRPRPFEPLKDPLSWKCWDKSWEKLTRVGDQWTLEREDTGEVIVLDVIEAAAWLAANNLVLWNGMSWEGDQGGELDWRGGEWTEWVWWPADADPREREKQKAVARDFIRSEFEGQVSEEYLLPRTLSPDRAWQWLECKGYRRPVPVQAVLDKAVPVGPTECRFARPNGDYWEVQFNTSEPTRLTDMDGLVYIAALLRRPHKPIAAVALVALTTPPPPRQEGGSEPVEQADLNLYKANPTGERGQKDSEENYKGGPARRKRKGGLPAGFSPVNPHGAFVDRGEQFETARAYLKGYLDMQARRDRAYRKEDFAAVAQVEKEIADFLQFVAPRLGRGGLERLKAGKLPRVRSKAGEDDAERARNCVRKALQAAYQKLADLELAGRSPRGLVKHLEKSITTGHDCIYQPADPPPAWLLD
jgi:hypothetical protein